MFTFIAVFVVGVLALVCALILTLVAAAKVFIVIEYIIVASALIFMVMELIRSNNGKH